MSSKVLDLHANLPARTRHLADRAKSWAVQELERLIAHHYEAGTLPPDIFANFARHRPELVGYTLPSRYGGQGYELEEQFHVTAALASVDASFTTALLVQYGLCAESILLCGNEEQKQRLLPPLARLEHMGCFALSEPQSGSDASDLKTTARPCRRTNPQTGQVEEGFVLSGHKRWIGNALTAKVMVVWARHLGLPGHPIVGFVVEPRHQISNSSIVTSKIHGKVSLRMVQNANIEFDEAWCPMENVMMDHVGFAASVGRVLEASRISVAWVAVGIAQGALDKTVQYAMERQAFGAPLAANQLVQAKLVQMKGDSMSMYLMALRVTQEYVAGRCSLPAIALAKAHCSQLGRSLVALGREILGGNGIVLDYGIASKFCDMEAVFTYEGTYDINLLVAGRGLTGISAIKSFEAMRRRKTKKKQQQQKPISKL